MPNLWANDAFIISLKENQNKKLHPTEFSKMMYNYGRVFLVNELLNVKKGEVVLDIGCADGFFLHQHQELIVPIGLDISCTMIKKSL